MRVRGDAARLDVDGLTAGRVVRRVLLATVPVGFVATPLLAGRPPHPAVALVCALLAWLALRGIWRRPRLHLDRASGEMILTRNGEEIRASLADLSGARAQLYEPRLPRARRRAIAGVPMRRTALVVAGREVPFEFGYTGGTRAQRLADAVNGWLGVDEPAAPAPPALDRRAREA